MINDSTTFEVSLPICTDNQIYTTTGAGKRVKSAKYKRWIKQAGQEYMCLKRSIIRQNGALIIYSCHVSVTIEITDAVRKGNSKNPRDLTNHNKQAVDFLVKMGLLKDDDLVDECIMRWVPAKECAGMRLTIEPV